jgi:bifunctional non-homologous end joining protein LigD
MSSLSAYVKKRNFARTKEPRGASKKTKSGSSFVIQKHDASRLHYDFRLEMAGTLKSWALPKGVPWKRGEKHLAVEVEDHPLEYATFEGIIPEGQYGGGTVMVWDTGTYECLSPSPTKALAEGKLHLALHGKKLEGEWTLVRLGRGDGNEWLIIKSGEDVRPLSKKRDDESSASGRTMAQIAKERTSEWRSGGAHGKMEFIEPMKATLVEAPPTHGDWLYELKFDGYRALALKNGDDVQLLSRNNKDFAKKFPEIVEAVRRLPVDRAILDGEIVATDEAGRSSFQLLQALEMTADRPPLSYYVFDLLENDGDSLLELPLHERRAQLKKFLKSIKPPLFFSAELEGTPEKLLEAVRAQGMEGLIGKERASLYVPGQRSRSWIKLKCVGEQEMVIGGYTEPEGTRKHFGALLVGYYDGGEFRFAGKVGTGFTAASLKALYQQMRKLARQNCPFANLPEKQQGRWEQNITPREMKLCHWVKPQLVCQVRYTEWTTDGKLRHPVFAGLREDKAAREVGRERAAKKPTPAKRSRNTTRPASKKRAPATKTSRAKKPAAKKGARKS